MKSKLKMWTRRRMLRGVLAGGAVCVGLPILDCMLDDNGSAFADTGAPLPTRFATWFWPLGLGEGPWTPASAGGDYELPWQMAAIKPFQRRLNLFSGSQVFLDGAANQTHFTGVQGYMTGRVTASGDYFSSTDAIIADSIGARTRFRALVAACEGDNKTTWLAFASGKVPAEVSPLALYKRIFGPEFSDPNAATFVPDPETMVRRSVLSGVANERSGLEKKVGAVDRQKLDYYFTALRSLEQKLDIQLQKPAPLPACTKPAANADDGHALFLATEAMARHDLFCQLMTHALACDQTRVISLNISQGMTPLRQEGDPTGHHSYTHEEPVDPKLGYQVKCSWFQQLYFQGLYRFASMLDGVKEGERSLLDRMILFAFTEHGAPRLHSVRNYPFITIGDGNGRIKTGMHIPMPGDTAARVTFTIQQAMGVPVSSWGTGSNHVDSPISGVLARSA
jgi:hypothetical protein